MSITVTGYVFILLTLYGFIFNPKFLYTLTIFFIPFSATAVINVGAQGEGSAIQPYMFIGLFWMVSFYLRNKSKIIFLKTEFKAIKYLLLFTLVALFSLIMPIYINGLESGNISGKLGEYLPILFSSKNITQFIYLLFGVLFAITIYLHNKNKEQFLKTVRTYSNSIIFVIGWGLLELSSKFLGFKYPAIIFNNSFSASAGGFGAVLDDENGISRIASVTVEASILTQTVIVLLPFLIFARINKSYLYTRGKDLFFTVIIIIFILRSTSTTGLLGLFFLAFICGLFYLNTLTVAKRIKVIFYIGILFPLTLLFLYIGFSDYINNVLFTKGDSYSALERSEAIKGAWTNFTHYPLLGTGWGSVSSFDLFIRILSNVGILGCIFFILFILAIIKGHQRAVNTNNYYIHSSLFVSFSVLMFTNAISGFSFTFGFFWLITGLSLVLNFNQKKHYEYRDE